MDIDEILLEDARRRAVPRPVFDPLRGDADDPTRVEVSTPLKELPRARVPRTMVEDPQYDLVCADPLAWELLRCRHDFTYWCVRVARIKPKDGFGQVPFVLNYPQRKLLAVMEADRLAGRPIRVILLKSRQWGGSTLIQHYMAWIQLLHRTNWNSVIGSNLKDTSATVKAMYDNLLAGYPEELLEPDAPRPAFKGLKYAANTSVLTGRDCRVTVGSVNSQEFARGSDIAMAHLTEVAFWSETHRRNPEDLVRAVYGSIPLLPYTFVAMESTANGVGNYFHREWQRCRDGKGDKHCVFVPWYEVEMCRLAPQDRRAFAASLDDYEHALFERFGLDLDQINWYHMKRAEQASEDKMMAEYPTTDEEAFAATSWSVFHREPVEQMRRGCEPGVRGELSAAGDRLVEDPTGALTVWRMPEPEASYVAAVDIGGRSAGADWSVVAVLRTDTQRPEVVAQWVGHTDHDLLADRAAAIGRLYNDALLAVESNTLESDGRGGGSYILDRLSAVYPNLYRRTPADEAGAPYAQRPGFHTNRRTKEMIITHMVQVVREGGYVERDGATVDELLAFRSTPDGRMGAAPGYHDDRLMTRAIALYIAAHRPPVAADAVSYGPCW